MTTMDRMWARQYNREYRAGLRRLQPPVERFWRNVDRSGGPDACWPWTGYRDPDGYGKTKWDGRSVRSHRLALLLTTGEALPPTVFACHRCDNPPCCNPAHLFAGKSRDNVHDMLSKGRQRFEGAPARLSQLSEADIVAICQARQAGQALRAIAAEHGIDPSYVSILSRGRYRPQRPGRAE